MLERNPDFAQAFSHAKYFPTMGILRPTPKALLEIHSTGVKQR